MALNSLLCADVPLRIYTLTRSWSHGLAAAKPFQQQFGSPDTTASHLMVVIYNLHGLNQGCAGVREMINVLNPDVIMIQEHWLFPSNMYRLNFCFFAMDSAVGAGPFYGRPYGGVAILIKKKLMPFTVNVFTADRLIAVKIADWLLINVYMPCSGTDNRQLQHADLLVELHALFSHSDCRSMISGDFNINLDCPNSLCDNVNDFLRDNNLVRCDTLFPVDNQFTYVNESLNSMSCIDYFVTSDPASTITFNILDLDVNFSDHLPIMAVLACHLLNNMTERKCQASFDSCVTNLRWYYKHTSPFTTRTR